MRAGWREFIKQRLRKPSEFFSVGIEWGDADIQISTCKILDGRLTWVKHHHLSKDNWPRQLADYVQSEKLTNTPCHITLSANRYQILQVDRPNVAATELQQALVWTVQDLLGSQDPLAVDYFDQPAQMSGADKLNVVAFPRQEIRQICMGVADAGLVLGSIGVAELVTCDLVDSDQEAVMMLVQQPGQEICLTIVKQGQLYFSRRLRGYENLSSFTEQELQMGVGDNLGVEIQRSMDYFESQLKQAPVKKIYLGLATPNLAKLSDILQQLTLMPVERLHPNIEKVEGLNFSGAVLPSLGAAMSQQSQSEPVAS